MMGAFELRLPTARLFFGTLLGDTVPRELSTRSLVRHQLRCDTKNRFFLWMDSWIFLLLGEINPMDRTMMAMD